MSLLFATALALVGCAARAVPPPAKVTGPAPDPFFIPREVQTVIGAFAAQLARDVPRARCDALAGVFGLGSAFDRWCRQVVAARAISVEVEHELLFMQEKAAVFSLGLYAKLPGGTISSFVPGEAAVAHLQDRHVRRVDLDRKLEALVGGRILRQSALIGLEPERRWLEADTKSVVRVGSAPFVALRLRNEGTSGFRVHEVSQDGEPCRHRRVGSWLLLVAPARPAPEITLRLRYGGKAPWRTPLDHVRPDEVILRKEALWLPRAPEPTAAELEVTVVRPAEFELFGQGTVVAERPLPDGRGSTTWRHRGDGFALYGGPDFVVRRVERNGSAIELGARAADPGHLDALDRVVTQALNALAPLGPYPYAELRVTESDFGGGQAGYGALSNITLGRSQARNLPFLTHELAHGWFPGAVPVAAGYWPEGLAEYLSSWALGPTEARAQRDGWIAACDEAAPGTTHSSLVPPGEPWSLQKVFVYDCPAAALAALEERHGREAVSRALVGFLRARTGKPSTWDDVIAAFGRAIGPEAATELRLQLGSGGQQKTLTTSAPAGALAPGPMPAASSSPAPPPPAPVRAPVPLAPAPAKGSSDAAAPTP